MENNEKQIKRQLTKNLVMIIISVIVVASVILPLPYYIEVPGSAENVRDFISVEGKRDNDEGSFMLTTVGIRRGTAISLLAAQFIPFQEIISKKELMGTSTSEEYEQLTAYQMSSSENMAKKVALDLADEPYEFAYKGIYVMNVSDDSNFRGKIKTGDVVYQVNDQKFKSSEEFIEYVQGKKIGDNMTIKFRRNGEDKEASGKLIELDDGKVKKAGIGITLTTHSELETKKDISIHTADIGGPSAGLMFTLSLYNLLSGKDLRQGREIAGTGTINEEGLVGSIGGIDKKIVAADREGATVFFAPAEEVDPELKKEYPELQTNYEEAVAAAKKIKTKMEIVPVKTVQDALDYLEK